MRIQDVNDSMNSQSCWCALFSNCLPSGWLLGMWYSPSPSGWRLDTCASLDPHPTSTRLMLILADCPWRHLGPRWIFVLFSVSVGQLSMTFLDPGPGNTLDERECEWGMVWTSGLSVCVFHERIEEECEWVCFPRIPGPLFSLLLYICKYSTLVIMTETYKPQKYLV